MLFFKESLHSQIKYIHLQYVNSNSILFGFLYKVCDLRQQAVKLGLPVAALGVKIVLERLMEITETKEVKEDEEKGRRCLLTFSQRVSVFFFLVEKPLPEFLENH